jgi:hypothetical protein
MRYAVAVHDAVGSWIVNENAYIYYMIPPKNNETVALLFGTMLRPSACHIVVWHV